MIEKINQQCGKCRTLNIVDPDCLLYGHNTYCTECGYTIETDTDVILSQLITNINILVDNINGDKE